MIICMLGQNIATDVTFVVCPVNGILLSNILMVTLMSNMKLKQ